MSYRINSISLFFFLAINVFGQNTPDFEIELEPIIVPELPGLHSYAFGQHDGKWLIIGGRKDGLHAKQPFNTFPQSQSNSEIYVVDIQTKQFWSSTVNSLPTGIREQLQSTNMNFYQDEDTLYIIGGYAFSNSANSHITFPNLTSIQVSSVIEAIIEGDIIDPYFKQISDEIFAITGGQLGKIGDTFYLVGGQKFDGLYNPMGHMTFTQTYSNQIRKFKISNSDSLLSISNYSAITDPIHLRRRDYNLLPQIFPNGTEGYTISSGVFQLTADLPFLYPVDITASGYNPITTFNQYLSNYHSAKVALYDSVRNEMHNLFFGGMSQYYYENGTLIQDDQVPFVKTISCLTRYQDGSLQEFQLAVEMPGLQGASAEFIPNKSIPHYPSEIIKLSRISNDTTLIGHIYGGILSPGLNPFASNQTSATSADQTIYAVNLISKGPAGIYEIDGNNPYSMSVYPNPISKEITMEIYFDKPGEGNYFITNGNGQIIAQGSIKSSELGLVRRTIPIDESLPAQAILLTVVIDNKYYLTKKLLKR